MNTEQKQFIRSFLTAVAVGALGFFVIVWLLSPIFSGRFVVPQTFNIGGFKLQLYGLLLGLGVLAGYLVAMKRKALYNIPEDKADTIIFLAIVFGFIGARLYHVVSEYPYYLQNLGQIFAIWNGGLSIFGAGLGAVIAIFVYHKFFLKKTEQTLSFLSLLDWLTPSILLGQIIGRFGNFVNYELYGYPTTLPWKMYVPVQFRLPPYELSQFFHPLFLYEAMGSVIILILILKLKLRHGSLFLMWLLLYNVMRFFLEFLRVDSVVHGSIRVNAVVAAILAVLGATLWYKFRNHTNNVIPNSPNN